MKIVFFDIQKWERAKISKAFPSAILEKAPFDETTAEKYRSAEIISGFIYSKFNQENLSRLNKLSYIATRSTGFDHIDLNYCKSKNILVSNVPSYGSKTVAEFAFALILEITKKLNDSVQMAKLQKPLNRAQIRGIELYNKTIGLLGFGKIGKETAKIANGFGMQILVYNRSRYPEYEKKYNLKFVDLKTVLRKSDIISLHLPLTDETYHILNKDTLKLCKKGAIIINTARGGLIDQSALLCAIEDNHIAMAGLDVLEEEDDLQEEIEILTGKINSKLNYKELLINHILINHPRIITTPHNAFNTREALDRITMTTILNINNFLKKTPINLV
ncbi:MAG: lactate dehydrogenase [Patescibacteria group bacterium]|nr:MAG: lactate dehydrogenase [Patescibacteria group bacterium]